MFPYLRRAGFYGSALIGYVKVDNALITALVERWRPETHTFHIPEGECTITLEDVEILMGLRVAGIPVVGRQYDDWSTLCGELLGVTPNAHDIKGNTIRTAWLNMMFGVLPANATEEMVIRYTRAYLLKLMAGILFPDKNSNRISLWMLQFIGNFDECGSYSWGAAVLAHVYRELCKASRTGTKQIAGCMTLVQLWAYERFRRISPTNTFRPIRGHASIFARAPYPPRGCRWTLSLLHDKVGSILKEYRREIDRTGPNDFIWRPYMDVVRMQARPGSHIYRAVVPLIGFSVVEWHQPDRVMRQFGLLQHIPSQPQQDPLLHVLDAKRNMDDDWLRYYADFILRWNTTQHHTIPGIIDVTGGSGSLDYASAYMVWYRSITR